MHKLEEPFNWPPISLSKIFRTNPNFSYLIARDLQATFAMVISNDDGEFKEMMILEWSFHTPYNTKYVLWGGLETIVQVIAGAPPLLASLIVGRSECPEETKYPSEILYRFFYQRNFSYILKHFIIILIPKNILCL